MVNREGSAGYQFGGGPEGGHVPVSPEFLPPPTVPKPEDRTERSVPEAKPFETTTTADNREVNVSPPSAEQAIAPSFDPTVELGDLSSYEQGLNDLIGSNSKSND